MFASGRQVAVMALLLLGASHCTMSSATFTASADRLSVARRCKPSISSCQGSSKICASRGVRLGHDQALQWSSAVTIDVAGTAVAADSGHLHTKLVTTRMQLRNLAQAAAAAAAPGASAAETGHRLSGLLAYVR